MSFSLDDIWIEKIGRLGQFSLCQQRRIYRIIMVCAVGASYFVDTLLLVLFSYAGAVDYRVPFVYGSAALGHMLLFSAFHWTGFSERFENPQMTVWQMIYALAVQLTCISIAPQMGFLFLGIIFIIFGFATLRISIREALLAWFFTCLSVAAVLSLLKQSNFGLMSPTLFQMTLIWIAFASILLRTIGLGYYAKILRIKLYEKTSSLEETLNQSEFLATHDFLTGTLNRRAIIPALDEQVILRNRKSIPACVAMIDLDRFKSINDSLGHLAGDAVLRSLAERISAIIRGTDRVGRYGGEEFLLVLPATSLEEGMNLMERIREDTATATLQDFPENVRITVSCGITEIRPSDTVAEAIARADQAMYEAKQRGRNQVHVVH